MIVTEKKMKCENHENGHKNGSDNHSVPSLCLTCKCFFADDWFEKILCKANRKDNGSSKKFHCKAYLKM